MFELGDWWIGLSRGGQDAVADAVAVTPYEPVRGAFVEVVEWLHLYHFEDGKVLKEVVHEVYWQTNAGPLYFTVLQTQKGHIIKGSTWAEEELKKHGWGV